MPEVRFNKNITNVPDCVGVTVKPMGYLKARLILINFTLGYDIRSQINFLFNGEYGFNLGLFDDQYKPNHNQLVIDRFLLFNGLPVTIEIDYKGLEPLDVVLQYLY